MICKMMTWGLSFRPGILRVTCPGDAKAAVAAKAEEKRLGRGLGWAKITCNDTLIVFCGTYFKSDDDLRRGVTREGNNDLRSRCVLLV